jgi:hypothetical protein
MSSCDGDDRIVPLTQTLNTVVCDDVMRGSGNQPAPGSVKVRLSRGSSSCGEAFSS